MDRRRLRFSAVPPEGISRAELEEKVGGLVAYANASSNPPIESPQVPARKKGFVMNMQPSEAKAGFDIRIPPTEDPDLLKKRIDEEWAPATRNLTYQLIQQGSITDITGCPLITTTNDSNSWWSTFKEAVIAYGGKLQKPKILRSTTDSRSPLPDHSIIVNYDGFAEDVKVGDDLLVDGGMANLTFWRDGSLVRERNAMLPTISPSTVSFVKSVEITNHLKCYIATGCRDSDISVIAKIESIDSLKNLEEIIRASDGAMIARGDLGAQVPSE
ncbi:uncharacterized protein A4U43_C04F11310 [Asparagus officinalis]|uniref:Pyruvate kinase n=1 Tax=Asparagus officinalis TaxID=4686 RepID=A0A5P1F2Q9_ASPOF|nr:uncharacterized protein A4U43_C04F11310 [Asparagus officinalis]